MKPVDRTVHEMLDELLRTDHTYLQWHKRVVAYSLSFC